MMVLLCPDPAALMSSVAAVEETLRVVGLPVTHIYLYARAAWFQLFGETGRFRDRGDLRRRSRWPVSAK